jgi:hypothetical protein
LFFGVLFIITCCLNIPNKNGHVFMKKRSL